MGNEDPKTQTNQFDRMAAPSETPPTGPYPLTGAFSQAIPSVEVMPPGYEFIRELGRGGFGTVWLARHLALEKSVAVKHLRPERLSTGGADPLVREARTMASLKVHPNRVTVFDLIRTDTDWFLIMEFVAGGSLARLISQDGPIDWVRATRYVMCVAEALAEVHDRGILHRDIKPDNILLDLDRDTAVLTDFGLAAHAAHDLSCGGTLGYMAPEIFAGKFTAKSDVFALAATLFYLVTGPRAFDSRDPLAALSESEAGPSEAIFAGLWDGVAAVVRAGLDPSLDRRPDLAAFTAMLRGSHTAGLAERLRTLSSGRAPAAGLNVMVSTATEKDLVFRTVYRGPAAGSCPSVRCDEIVRIETEADANGYLTMLNLSSSGEVGVLFPNPRMPDNRIRAGRPQRLTVKLTPPAGTDLAVLVWTPGPCLLSAREWRAARVRPAGAHFVTRPWAGVRGRR
jgi:hypothetical protein